VAKCNSCEAEIEWAESATTGKPVPLNVGATPDGSLAVVNGKAHAYTLEDLALKRDRRTSHFATCPDADDWRKPDAGVRRARGKR